MCQYDNDEMLALASSTNNPPMKGDLKIQRSIGQQENVPNNKQPLTTNDYNNNNHNGSYELMKHMKRAISSNWIQKIDWITCVFTQYF